MEFGFWRAADVTKLSSNIRASSIGSLNEEVSEGHFQFLKRDVAVRVLHSCKILNVANVLEYCLVQMNGALLRRSLHEPAAFLYFLACSVERMYDFLLPRLNR